MDKEKNLLDLAEKGEQQANYKSWKTFELEYTLNRWYNLWRLVTVFGIVGIFSIGLILVSFLVDDPNAVRDKYFGVCLAFLFIPFILLAVASQVVKRDRDIASSGRYMSGITNFFRVNLGVKIVYFTFWLAFLAYAWPYFRFFHTHKTVIRYEWRLGMHTKFNPDEHGGYMAFYLFALFSLPLILFALTTPFAWWQRKQRLKAEKGWLAVLPFSIIGYPEALMSQYEKFRFTICWQDRKHIPDSDFFGNIALGFNKKTIHERSCDSDQITTDLITVDFENDWTAQKKSNFKFYKFFHKFTEVILLKLHENYPIANVKVDYR